MSRSQTVKDRNIENQLDPSRDFENPGTPNTRYVICCTHRSGSNLLSEALYHTGAAGDPMEFLNIGFVQKYRERAGTQNINFYDLMNDMETRRTSPNGVFGLNVKYDQMQAFFRRIPNPLVERLRSADRVFFLHRQDRLQQAISTVKGQMRGTFNVYAEDADEVEQTHGDLPFRPGLIAQRLFQIMRMERQWEALFERFDIVPEILTYEDLNTDYAGTIARVLRNVGVDPAEVTIPDPPTVKVRDSEDDRLRQRFLAHIGAADG
mgnify:CR=1 FL=1